MILNKKKNGLQSAYEKLIEQYRPKCVETLKIHYDCILRLKAKIKRKKINTTINVIAIINRDTVYTKRNEKLSSFVKEVLLPGVSFCPTLRQIFRTIDDKTGKKYIDIIFVRGLFNRYYMQEALDMLDDTAARKLRNIEGLAAIVFDGGVFDVFSVQKKYF